MKRTYLVQAVGLPVILAGIWVFLCGCQAIRPPVDGQPGAAAVSPAQETDAQRAARLRWWRDARFGMFIHWGPVSLKGTEIGWSRGAQIPIEEYDHLYRQFNPTNYHADEWMRVARQAGMKYVVITTKHHDGFCMWNTRQTDFNIMGSPFGRDVVKELAAAARRQGLVFSTYYSVCDWHHPDFPRTSPGGKVRRETSNLDRYEQYLRAQVSELLTNYGPLGVMWFDVPQEFDAQRGQGLIDFVRGLQPSLIVNNRSGAPGDYDTPEQRIGKFQNTRPWETCMTICRQWAWKPDDTMKSLQECLRALILCAGGDGNLLFNVGPMPDGRLEPRQVDRLKEMGAWLRKYGQSIYGTRGGPWKPGKDFASTRQGQTVFLHVLRWNGDTLTLPDLPFRIISASLLTGGKVRFTQADNKLTLTVAPADQRDIDTIIQLKLAVSAMDLEPMSLSGAASLATGKPARASNIHRNQPQYGPEKAVDDDDQTRWATDGGTKSAWLEVDLGQAARIGRVAISEAVARRAQKFELQYQDGGEWKTCLAGTTIGEDFERSFPPITARLVRLNILEATDGPTLSDFRLLPPEKPME